MKAELNNKKLRVYVPLTIVILLVLTGSYYWYMDYSQYITTDDAHVDAENVNIGSKVMGRIANLYTEEGSRVKKGDILAEIDSTDLIAQRNQLISLKFQTIANLNQAEIKYSSDQKSIKVFEINLEKSTDDLDRAKKQLAGGVITAEQFDHINKAYETALAQLNASRAQLLVSKSMISTASAAVSSADAQVKVLNTQMKNFSLYAPSDGIIAKKWLLPGDIVQPGQSIFSLTMNDNLWVLAFLEETKIAEISEGQKVFFSLDAFPDISFSGKIILVGSSTASVFSLIPANNASGNFTKVTQRIPVRVSIESAGDNNDLSSLNILSGMSAVIKILKNK